MENNLQNFNLQTGEEDGLAAIMNRRKALADKRRNLSSSKPSRSFNGGSTSGGKPPLRGRYALGLSQSFSFGGGSGGRQAKTPSSSASSKDNNEDTRFRFLGGSASLNDNNSKSSSCSSPPPTPTRKGRFHLSPSASASFNSKTSNSLPTVAETGIFSKLKSSFNGLNIDLDEEALVVLYVKDLKDVDHTSIPLKRRLDREHSVDEIVIDLINEDDHNSLGSDSVAGDDEKKEEEESFLHSQDDHSCDQSGDGSGVASSSIYSRFSGSFSGMFKGTRTCTAQSTQAISDAGTALTDSDDYDDSYHDSQAAKSAPDYYTLGDHSDFLSLSAETNGWRYCDIGPILTESDIPKLVKDYISPVSFEKLEQAYFGVKRTMPETDQGESRPEPLPIRTLAFRVRPDVPSQTIMGAVESSFSDIPESIVLTHQEGHYRCVMTSIPCIFDAQLCVATSEPFERTLLLRVYHAHDDETAMEKIDGIVEPSTLNDNEELMAFSTHLHLRQASSLVQLLSAESASPQTACPQETASDTAAHLMYKYESGPSVSEHTTDESANLLPALSAKDWFIVQSSESLCIRVWKMLTEINCVFQTVSTTPLGGLTDVEGSAAIDPSFCLQLQLLSCDAMMIEDLRATKDDAFDKHAWVLEERYLHFLQVLNNMWELYNIQDDRPLPEEMPVSEAPLTPDYVAIVAKVAAEYPSDPEKDEEDGQAPSKEDPKSPESVVDSIVRDVYAAYSKLNEDQFRAYCKGKNAQIIARVNAIKKHEKEIICFFENPWTEEMQSAATECSTLVAKVKQKKGDEVSDDEPVEVPILKVPMSGTGICYITRSKIIYSTPGFLGKTLIFDLDAVQFEATSGACMTILLKNGERGGCKIWPSSLDVHYLTEFIDTLTSLQLGVECCE
jgi:hypothetical protein